jgi:hypothetical protein
MSQGKQNMPKKLDFEGKNHVDKKMAEHAHFLPKASL